jgi:hypothetical protein
MANAVHRRAAGLNAPSACRAQPQVPFGAKRTSTGRQDWLDRSKMTPSGHLKHLVTDRAMEAWYHPFIACMTPNRRVTWQATSNDENS